MVNTYMSNATRLRQFTINYFTALGANPVNEGELLRVELEPDQMAELEGRTGPRISFWGMQEESTTVLYLAFNREATAANPHAELIAPGSHRLEQMFASARRQGRLALLTLLPRGALQPGNELYKPNLLLHFRLANEGRSKSEQFTTVCVDLTDGSVHPEIARRAENAQLTERLPHNIAERVLGFKDAWEIACREVVRYLRTQDDGWARESLLALAQEKRFLDQYYSEQTGEVDTIANEHQERLAEAERRCRPRVVARTTLGAILLVADGNYPSSLK